MGVRAMTSQQALPEPPRLVTDRDSVSLLLAQSERAFRADLAEGPAWQRFQERTRRRHWVLWLAPAVACFAVVVVQARVRRAPASEPAALSVAAEPVTPRPVAIARAEVAATEAATATAPKLERRIPSASLPLLGTRPGDLKGRPVASDVDDATCRRWASEGRREEATQCFEVLGRGSGLAAEVALYQAARLSSDVLHDAPRALALLDRHQQRFPGGPLRTEVEWLRVQNLEKVGQLDEALSASEALLTTPSGRALGSKLHLLRGHIYANAKGDCAHAVREFVALLGEPGAEGDEAELERAECLEKLARPAEARAAYERYARRADARHLALAEQRLLELAPAPEGRP